MALGALGHHGPRRAPSATYHCYPIEVESVDGNVLGPRCWTGLGRGFHRNPARIVPTQSLIGPL